MLLASIRHHDSLHERVLMIHVAVARRPRVHPMQRATIVELGGGFTQVDLTFGFLEQPDVPAALAERVAMKLGLDLETISYFVGRETLLVTARPGMARWREHVYALMSRNATDPTFTFSLPPDQVLELGVIVEL